MTLQGLHDGYGNTQPRLEIGEDSYRSKSYLDLQFRPIERLVAELSVEFVFRATKLKTGQFRADLAGLLVVSMAAS